jgi:hypothetical protein
MSLPVEVAGESLGGLFERHVMWRRHMARSPSVRLAEQVHRDDGEAA